MILKPVVKIIPKRYASFTFDDILLLWR